jgi:hypothetical protein
VWPLCCVCVHQGVGSVRCVSVCSDFSVAHFAFLLLLGMSVFHGVVSRPASPASRPQSKSSLAGSCTPQRGARPSIPSTPPMRWRKASTTTPGSGAAAQGVSTALSRLLKSSSQSIDVLRRLLISDPAAAVLPLGDGQSVLIFAMRHKCSLEVLRVLLAHGAQPEQVDAQGRNALSALAAMSLPFVDDDLPPMPSGGPFGNVGGFRPCATFSRLHVSYAIELLRAGVQPVVEEVGKGNEACVACIREYKDALAAVVIRRWMRGDGAMEWLRLVADYVHCK